MYPSALLGQIALIVVVGVVVTVVVGRLRLPTVTGLLLSGALIGPHALGLVSDVHAIEQIAEVGVVLLLFMIGLEFSLDRLRHIFGRVAIGGLLQVFGTIAVVVVVALLLGQPLGTAVFYGFVFALSSTAIVLKMLSERQELDAPHGRFIVAALILQDLLIVPMVLLVPFLGRGAASGANFAGVALALGKAVVVVVGVLLAAKLVAPRAMQWVAALRSRDVFILAVLSVCIGTAWVTSLMGLSLALGAFLGGVVVAGTEYRHRAIGELIPLRDAFVSIFFVSLGMLFDARVLLEKPWVVLLCLSGFIFVKGIIATGAALVMQFPPRAAWLAGVGLAQFGEFAFVLVQVATAGGVVKSEDVAPLLTAGIISMVLTPLFVHRAPHISAGERILVPLARLLRARTLEERPPPALEDHIVVVGYGLAGRLLASSLREIRMRHVILDLNVRNVREGRARKDPVYYADGTSEAALEHAHVRQARAVIVLINDPHALFRVVDTARRVAPEVPVFVRTRYLADRGQLFEVGATDVVAEEVESAVEVLARVLRELDVPRNIIDAEVDGARARTQHTARTLKLPRAALGSYEHLARLKVESVLIPEDSPVVGRSLRELDLRRRTGALVVAIRRGEDYVSHPSAGAPLRANDVAYLVGDAGEVRRAVDLLGSAGSSKPGPDGSPARS